MDKHAHQQITRSPCSLTLSRPLTGTFRITRRGDDLRTPSRLKCSLRSQVLVVEGAVPVRLVMASEPTALTAAMWRSCGSAVKTGGIAGSCSLSAQMSHKLIPADRGHCGTIRNL